LAKLTRSRAVLVKPVVIGHGVLCTGTLVLSVFDLSKMEAAAGPRVGLVPRAKLGDLPKNRQVLRYLGILKGRCASTALHSPAATFGYTIFKIPLD
jgi:hypothetical protein